MTRPSPPYQYPPLLEVTPTDHTAWIAIATVLGLCCALVTALLRVFVRTVISPPFGHDDTIVLIATAFATIQSAVVIYGVSKGLGRSEHLVLFGQLEALQKAAYASDILYLVPAYLSKCSIIFLLLRLTPDRKHRIAFHTTLAAIVILCIASIITISIRCNSSHPWLLFHEKCTGLLLRWQVVTAFDILTEVAIFGVSFYLFHGLHMSLTNRSIIVGVFALRLVIIPFLIIRLISFPDHHLSTDPSFTLTYFYIWTQSTLDVSLIVSTVPCLKPFVASLNTGYGAFDTEHVAASRAYGTSYGSANHTQQRRNNNSRIKLGGRLASARSRSNNGPATEGESFTMVDHKSRMGARDDLHGSLSQKDTGVSLDPRVNAGQQVERRRGEGKPPTYTTSAVAQDGNSIGSDDSRQMIIRKDVTWAVEYSDPGSRGK